MKVYFFNYIKYSVHYIVSFMLHNLYTFLVVSTLMYLYQYIWNIKQWNISNKILAKKLKININIFQDVMKHSFSIKTYCQVITLKGKKLIFLKAKEALKS